MTLENATQQIELVPVSSIIIDDWNQVREEINKDHVKELAADIFGNPEQEVPGRGLINPITLRRDNNNEPHLVAGRYRLEAYKYHKEERILATFSNVNEKESILVTIDENIRRSQYSVREEALAMKAALKAGWQIPELALKEHKTQDWIKDRLAILELDQPVQQMVHEGKIGPEVLKKAVIAAPAPIRTEIARKIVSDHLDLREAQRVSNQATSEYNEEQAFKKMVEESKFKTCPTCKGKPTGKVSEYIGTGRKTLAQCPKASDEFEYDHLKRAEHTWDLNTSKTLKQIREERVAQERKTAAKSSNGRTKTKNPPILNGAFRSTVPISVLQKAVMSEAIAYALKFLKEKRDNLKQIELTVTDRSGRYYDHLGPVVSVQVDDAGATMLRFHMGPEESRDEKGAHFEHKKYDDKAGNITKVNPYNITASTQSGVDVQKEKFRKWLYSLPEVADYMKKHKGQKKL